MLRSTVFALRGKAFSHRNTPRHVLYHIMCTRVIVAKAGVRVAAPAAQKLSARAQSPLRAARSLPSCRACSGGGSRSGENRPKDDQHTSAAADMQHNDGAQGDGKQKMMQRGELHHVFELVDSDADGMITPDELGTLMQYLDLKYSAEELQSIARALSDRDDGLIAEGDFVRLVAQNSPNQQYQREQTLREQQAALLAGDKASAVHHMFSRAWVRQKWQLARDELRLYGQGLQMLLRQFFLLNKMLLNLFNPLGKSFLKLDVRERNRMWRTTVDVLRFVPFCVLVIAPGGGVLVAMLAKKFPSLLPSSFRAKSEVRGEEDVYEAIQALAVDVRRKKSLQDQADAIFGDFVGELAQLTAQTSGAGAGKAELQRDAGPGDNSELGVGSSCLLASMGERMRLATKYSALVSFGGRVPIDTVALCDNLSLAQLKVLCSAAHLPASASAGKLRPALRQHLATVGARDVELARDGANISALDAAELSKLCEERGIGGIRVDNDTNTGDGDGHNDRRCQPKITVQEQLADLQTWVHTTAGSASSAQPCAPPLFALMCQVEGFPDYERRREHATGNLPWAFWRHNK